MTDRPDIQAQAMCRELRQEGYLVPYPVLVKAMQAAALRPEAQGVKPLEWVEAGSYGHLFAGPYEISFSGNKRRIGLYYHYIREGRQEDERLFSGENTEGAVERLKASAEEHNKTRTLSALDRPEAQDGVASAAKVLLENTPNPVFDILKPVLMGEHSIPITETDEDGEEVVRHVPIPWDWHKQIIRDALRALSQGGK